MGEQNLRGSVGGASAFAELLQEHFAENDVVLIAEYSAEHDRHSVGLRFDVHRLIVPVVDHGTLVSVFAC